MLVWGSFGNIQFALTRTVTVLVIACPHALGLAIPLVVALSTAITAKSGILIRDRKAFENAKDVNAVVFDKTGTLTTGQFGVSEHNFIDFREGPFNFDSSSRAEFGTHHRQSHSQIRRRHKGITIPKSQDFEAIPGKGAKAKVNGKTVYVGSLSLLKELNIQNGDIKMILDLQKASKTTVFTVVDGELAGVFVLADQIREESVKQLCRI